MLIPSFALVMMRATSSLSRRVNANSQLDVLASCDPSKLIKKGEC